MDLWAFGANEHFGQIGVWDKWACGNWNKWAFGEMGILRQMGTLGPMSIEASRHWGKTGNLGQIGIWDIGDMGGLGQIP